MSDAAAPPPALDPRTRRLLEAPLLPTLLRLGTPNVLVLGAQAAAGLIETWFIGKLGVDALGGVALVFPVVMLMQMMSAGAIGGGISSSVARALGARRRDDADALAQHAALLSVVFGLAFTAAALLGGEALYRRMGGDGAVLQVALTYSGWVFAGAVLIWLFNALASVVRGTGNMAVPAIVTCVGTAALVPLSPLLIFGWGPLPALGVAGGALALLLYYLGGTLWLAWYLASGRSVVRPLLRGLHLRRDLLLDILRVGAAGAVSTVATNVAIAVATGYAGAHGAAAIAGYGTAARLEYLLVPLVFGFGGPLVAIVGTCMGAGQRRRALQATWTGAALAFVLAEGVGLLATAFPVAWMGLFSPDPDVIAAGSLYLRLVGPFYGFFGLGLVLYFASQGAGRLLWPVLANVVRLLVAATGGWLALRWGAGLAGVFAAQALALLGYGVLSAAAIAGGAWFGPLGWPRRTDALLRRLQVPAAP
ncbi:MULTISPECIES: MATE family efflux transporter [Ramlibacter]|uniref:MATE family efflux transporter n=1 Tax=Ramlibacter pinisoli TaxID=2682844 RepID=A0A6N8IUM4_9BURK|nr:MULTISPECIES: MATE family efflux transporter [Ramlibacter]MBA2964885.1 MATE family efflux transporter [Ramlibacter sp. CGMCC 1.13660]MVQ29850.1 MATE family efflux transporter [Ramlibacter pinisoli]